MMSQLFRSTEPLHGWKRFKISKQQPTLDISAPERYSINIRAELQTHVPVRQHSVYILKVGLSTTEMHRRVDYASTGHMNSRYLESVQVTSRIHP